MRFTAENATLRETVASRDHARAGRLLNRPLASDLVRVVGYDDGGTARFVTENDAAGARAPAFWERARPITPPRHFERRATPGGAVIWTLLGGNPWVCSELLKLDALAQAVPQEWYDPVLGLLVGAPTRSSVHVHLLGTAPDVRAVLVDLAVLCHAGFHTTPEQPHDPALAAMHPLPIPLVPTVYWFHDHALTDVPVDVDLAAGRVHVRPPAEFTHDVLDRLDGSS